MIRAIACAGLSVFAAGAALGQTAAASPAFDVASVKPNLTSRGGGEGSRREKVDHSPGSLNMQNVSFSSAVQWAYSVKEYQVSGPDWLASERYDVVAKAADAAPEAQLRLMLQALLADRFKLAMHRETRTLPVYELLVGKNGPKFQKTQSEGESLFQPSNKMTITIARMPMAQFMDFLSQPLRMPVLDKTGLKGRYDFKLDASAYLASGKPPEGGESELVLALVQEQLGLKLESKKAPIDMIVVDHAEKVPSEN
jgi:uncharacterized protein (TIGR03435 family)